jgi:gluconokinase
VDRDYALLGGATSEGGNVYAWLRQSLRLGEREELEAALAASEPDGHGLTVLPFLAGERSPGWAGHARATLHGVTVATTPADIVRANLEAIAYRFALIAERMDFAAERDYHLVASGSALLHSPAWMRIFADVLGRTVVASAETEATSRGAAVMALHALGEIPSLDALPAADGARYEPDGARHALYRAAVARQQWLYERIIRQE